MCVSSELIDQDAAEDSKEAYLTHPMLASHFNEQGGFAIRGTQAFKLSRQLIKGADDDFGELSAKNGGIGYYLRWIFGFHRVSDARNALRAFMEQAVNSEQTFNLEKQQYTFNRDGTVKESQYHVWTVSEPNIEKTPSNANTEKTPGKNAMFKDIDKSKLEGRVIFTDAERARDRAAPLTLAICIETL